MLSVVCIYVYYPTTRPVWEYSNWYFWTHSSGGRFCFRERSAQSRVSPELAQILRSPADRSITQRSLRIPVQKIRTLEDSLSRKRTSTTSEIDTRFSRKSLFPTLTAFRSPPQPLRRVGKRPVYTFLLSTPLSNEIPVQAICKHHFVQFSTPSFCHTLVRHLKPTALIQHCNPSLF